MPCAPGTVFIAFIVQTEVPAICEMRRPAVRPRMAADGAPLQFISCRKQQVNARIHRLPFVPTDP